MPELPEVETTMRGLMPLMEGQRVQKVDLRTKKLRFALPARFAARLTGVRIKAITRRAKYILIALDSAETLLVHLGMSGRFVKAPPKHTPAKHDHVILHLANGTRMVFNDPRRFGVMDLMATAKHAEHKLLKAIGPEPLEKEFSAAYLLATLKGKKAPIKNLLLDQRLVAGLGNIYVSEALFGAGIRPTRAGGKVTGPEAAKLVPAIKKVLKAALKAGGSSLRDYVQADGNLGFFQDRFAVYDRERQACQRCPRGIIKRITQGGRSTYYCPSCQR